jgi:DtxR family manganese transport transcriptional regulator
VRADHRTETAEDYTEAVAELLEKHGEARVKDLSEMMGVSHVTVSRVVSRLVERGLLDTEPYRPIALTEAGAELAARAKHRHTLAVRFLQAIGVPDETALLDAEGIEHHLSDETVAAVERFLAGG